MPALGGVPAAGPSPAHLVPVFMPVVLVLFKVAGLDLIRMANAVGIRTSVPPRILDAVGLSLTFEVEGIAKPGVPHAGLPRSPRPLKGTFDSPPLLSLADSSSPRTTLVGWPSRLQGTSRLSHGRKSAIRTAFLDGHVPLDAGGRRST